MSGFSRFRDKGRKVKGKCVKPRKSNARKRSCVRYTKVGAFRHQGAQGEDKQPFSGRIGRTTLKPGKYRATLSAVDAAGNRSKPKSVAFEVLKAKRG